MRLISKYTPKSRNPYWLRLPIIMLGLFLQLVSLGVSAIISLNIVIFMMSHDTSLVRGPFEILFLLTVGVSAGITGWWLLRGKRRMLLFLRRFGFDDATKVVARAIKRSVGRHWRVITLDDRRVSPIGVARGLPIGFAVVASIALFVTVAESVNIYEIWRADYAPIPQSADTAQRVIIFFKRFRAPIVFAAVFPQLVILGTLAIYLSWIPFMALRSNRLKRLNISKQGEIDGAIAKIATNSKNIFAPRFIVLTTKSEIWHSTVMRLVSHADAVVVDVSLPSDSLVWEIEWLQSVKHKNCIFVADSRSVKSQNVKAIGDFQAATRLRDILSGCDVITYSQAPDDQSKFERSLRSRLRDA